LTPGSRVTTAVEEDGALRTVFRVEREFDLPKRLERPGWRRSEEKQTLRIVDRIHVEKGLPCLRVRTTVENTCESHRLRVLFPTELACEESFADTPFAVVRRPIVTPPETANWQERVNPEKPFTSFFGVQGRIAGDDTSTYGLAVLSPAGLHEYAVTETDERSLALTLFRSTFQTVGTAGEPDGLLLGRLEYEYYLMPFEGEFNAAEALRLVAAAQAGVRTHASEQLPEDTSMLAVESEACVVTAIKPAADGPGGIVRLWNPGTEAAPARIRFARKPRLAERCNLNEEPQETLNVESDGSVAVEVPAGGLASIRFSWGEQD
jgi:alpha-mannosidase